MHQLTPRPTARLYHQSPVGGRTVLAQHMGQSLGIAIGTLHSRKPDLTQAGRCARTNSIKGHSWRNNALHRRYRLPAGHQHGRDSPRHSRHLPRHNV